MVLLDPTEIKDEKKQHELEAQRRIASLGAEESAANKRVNDALAREKKEKERIAAEAEQGVPLLETKKTILQTEVAALEARKTEALRPVHEKEAAAEAKRIENNEQGELIAQKLAQLDRDQETLVERTEMVKEQEQENAQTKEKLDRRAKGITEQEAEIQRSAIQLGEKWVEYHEAIITRDNGLKTREQKVASDAKANEIYAAELKKVEVAQVAKDRAIADKYATLERAIKEFERKKNGKR